jgi:hypothetical protein
MIQPVGGVGASKRILLEFQVIDFLIGLAFVLMVIGPALLATFQKRRSRDRDD